jgi:acetyltransferase-like isoleucine patch superfamily enzyme
MKEFIQIGKYTYGIFDHNVVWDVEAWGYDIEKKQSKLIVGKYCSIGYNSKFFLGGNHRHDWITTYPFHVKEAHNNDVFDSLEKEINGYPLSNGDIIIGNDVWFGENVTVMSGVKIGDGAVVGTNSTVVRDVKPYSIIGGHPAKHIKYRFNDDVIEKLLDIKWWDIEELKLNALLPYMCNNDIDTFFKNYYNLIGSL